MKNISIKSVFIILSLAVLASPLTRAVTLTCNPPDKKEYKKEFTVEPGQELLLDLETGTEIHITGWDKNIVDIFLEVDGRDSDMFEVEFGKTSRGVEVISEYIHKSRRRIDCSSRIEIKVPNKFDVEFTTLGGDVIIREVEGNLEGETMGGDLDFSNLKGELECKTMGGSIELTDSDIDGSITTMGGKVKLENLIGDIDASTMGGSIIQRNVKGRSGSGGKELNISTMGGSIEIDEAPNGASAKTMGGDIYVEKVGKFLKTETMGGNIRVKELDGWIEAETMGGDIEVNMIEVSENNNRDVYLESKGGDILLSVPENFSMNIDIEIEWSGRHRQPRIEGDFDIEEDFDDDNRDRRRGRSTYITGSKIVNGGKNKVKIRTINGDVRIVKK